MPTRAMMKPQAHDAIVACAVAGPDDSSEALADIFKSVQDGKMSAHHTN
jgi:hypothetical protein